jgi:hypothetical protein
MNGYYCLQQQFTAAAASSLAPSPSVYPTMQSPAVYNSYSYESAKYPSWNNGYSYYFSGAGYPSSSSVASSPYNNYSSYQNYSTPSGTTSSGSSDNASINYESAADSSIFNTSLSQYLGSDYSATNSSASAVDSSSSSSSSSAAAIGSLNNGGSIPSINTVSNEIDDNELVYLRTTTTTLANREKLSRKHQLPDRAVDIMNEWFEEHLNNPYPQPVEKERLAQLGGISVKQVTAWFSNRRNRSQNTKPKRMKRVLEKEISEIYQELAYNPNKEQIMEKFRSTLANHEIGLKSVAGSFNTSSF